MKITYQKFFGYLLMLAMFIGSCTLDSEYDKMLKRELARGVRVDSLFLGLKLGMTEKEFYAICWDLNKQHIIHEGGGNLTAMYEIEGLKHKAEMNFYPTYHQGKIYEMPTTVRYLEWAPWNKPLSSDSLLIDVVSLFEKTYGGKFIKMEHPKKGVLYVKVDGNRRIKIHKLDEMNVYVLYTDLTLEPIVEKELADQKAKAEKNKPPK